MARLGLPSIEVIFKELGTSAIERGDSGVVAMVLEKADIETPQVMEIYSALDLSEDLDIHHRDMIVDCLKGSVYGVNKVIVVIAEDTLSGVKALMNYDFNYLVTPYIENSDCDEVATVVDHLRRDAKMVKYVAANYNADKSYVINFTTGGIKVGGEEIGTKEFTPRIAGIIASMPLAMSVTYQPIPEVEDVEAFTKEQLDTKIGNGELVLMNDGRKVKIARGVTSVTTTGVAMPESFRKIKILAIADLIKSDIIRTLQDSYIGKYPCDYDHKCLLISAINSYLKTLEREMLLDDGSYCEIDLLGQKLYLESKGINTVSMTDDEIMMANTGDNVYLKVNAKILDVIENIDIEITI